MNAHTKMKPGTGMIGGKQIDLGRSQERCALQKIWAKGAEEDEIVRLEEKPGKVSPVWGREMWEQERERPEVEEETRILLTS